MKITRETEYEDLTFITYRIGGTIIIRTERPAIARFMRKRIERVIKNETIIEESAIGFNIGECNE